jgi:hypothetical protein
MSTVGEPAKSNEQPPKGTSVKDKCRVIPMMCYELPVHYPVWQRESGDAKHPVEVAIDSCRVVACACKETTDCSTYASSDDNSALSDKEMAGVEESQVSHATYSQVLCTLTQPD